MAVDRPVLLRKLAQAQQRAAAGKPFDRALAQLQQRLRESSERRSRRIANAPTPQYPDELPVSERRAEIAAAIDGHQVVIVAGETGSGKTTQLPKICLELGRGMDGLIGHTQPRRIAARSVAARVASELQSELGGAVGYQVRFHDQLGADSYIKLMTDGILLAEIQSDPELRTYDTLIIDEAHERSLNIDFLLGYLKNLLPRRPDLKLVITSATIDTRRFARHFDNAPVVEVSGRTYPVDVRYRPLATGSRDAPEPDLSAAIVAAVDELAAIGPGDVLVFLPGERDIREAADALRKHHPPHTEILPLFARLSVSEQNKVFHPHGSRRIVLSTNVAETSLTVPGIRFVVDTGLARVSRYSHRSKVQRLPVEKVSQASCNQRTGRCGRLGPGVCIRLFDAQDFSARALFTEPEIQRTNLAAVILRMLDLGLGAIDEFPFVDAPDRRFINDGFRLLQELSAVDGDRRLTALGKQMARLPVDPRIGRMLLAARDLGCLREVLVIASALSIQDPRERPSDAQEQADQAHRQFADPRSDFGAILNLWTFYHEHARHLSRNKLHKLCQQNFLAFRRMQEWHELHQQLANQLKDMGLRPNQEEADRDSLHRAILTGLLSNIGLHVEDGEYVGSHGKRFRIFPGSAVRGRPKWIVAAELVETVRLFARTVAVIDPRWIEQAAGHLLRRHYSEPHWEKRAAQVAAYERVSLYGLDVVSHRKVNYGPIDPALARELFIREGLVAGSLQSRAGFFEHNRKFVADIEHLEDKTRRRDLLVDEQTMFEFYDARIPAGIYSGQRFERWRREAERKQPQLLYFDREQLLREDVGVSKQQFPDHLEVNGLQLPLHYRFEPGHPADGVTVDIPLGLLNQLPQARLPWLVPGLLDEKIAALIKALPKALRRNFVPAPEFAAACNRAIEFNQGDLLSSLSGELQRMTGVAVPNSAWAAEMVPDHLRMNVRVLDECGEPIDSDRDLNALKSRLGGQAEAQFIEWTAAGIEREDVADWDFGDLGDPIEQACGGQVLRVYRALQVEGDRIALRAFDTAEQARVAMQHGVCALYARRERKLMQYLQKNMPGVQQMCLIYAALGPCDELRRDLIDASVCEALFGPGETILTTSEFQQRSAAAGASLIGLSNALCAWIGAALQSYQRIATGLGDRAHAPPPSAGADIEEQLRNLVYRGFVAATPYDVLEHYPRYLKAIERRMQRSRQNPARDQQFQEQFAPLWAAWRESGAGQRLEPRWLAYRWRLEELRVSLFAQELGTAEKVSIKRLQQERRGLG